MQIGERGFEPALQPVMLDFNDWRATYRWPFIALCLALSLGVIASGGTKRADAGQLGEIAKSPPAVQTPSIPQNTSSTKRPLDGQGAATAIDIQTTPIAPPQVHNEPAQR
ncbi:hypothetical protein ELE36_10865 [Pseudolysobacter antarcticus]|uniref:Uncharacterized protein n=1 Tax=Pseudolysobacter antarcticus TaxID=2511995 RepID=A0A411HJV3_9GAMM|nr:hypothetical protein [Pseudolysobacter antarcticus]QBB70816.1 hypothetical protein ELE36_10865 [Pseudolysobacter antarcticus]